MSMPRPTDRPRRISTSRSPSSTTTSRAGVDGILFAANDPVAIAPVLKKALSKGINVVGYDANSTPDARQWFVNQAEFNGIAKALIDNMAKEIGEEGAFAIVTSTFTTPNQARWIAEMAAYAAEVPSQDEVARDRRSPGGQRSVVQSGDHAHQQIWRRAQGHVRHDERRDPGLGRSRDAGRTSAARSPSSALPTPNAMKPYVEKDCVKSVVLWNPGRSRLCRHAGAARGRRRRAKAGATSVKAGKLGDLQVINGSEILLGAPFTFTKENIGAVRFLNCLTRPLMRADRVPASAHSCIGRLD